MIEPIKNAIAQISIKSGNSSAKAYFAENSALIKFENPTPAFTTKIGTLVDRFLFSGDKTQDSLECFAIDTFEKRK